MPQISLSSSLRGQPCNPTPVFFVLHVTEPLTQWIKGRITLSHTSQPNLYFVLRLVRVDLAIRTPANERYSLSRILYCSYFIIPRRTLVMDPISGTSQILSILQQTLPQVVAALHSVTPDGRTEEIVEDMRRSARELAGCADAGIISQERMQTIHDKINV